MLTHPFLGAENALFHLIGEIFHPFFELFGLILAGLYAIWPNYGFAIAGLTIIIMLALTPVTVKSTKSMLAMQRLQPEMKKLQAKYKGAENREILNQEMMRLYKENGTSPFGACLPSLLQMPFLIVLYTLIRGLSTTVSHGQKYINQAGHYVTCLRSACGAPRYIPTNSQMHSNLVASQGQMHWWFGMDLSSYPFSNHTTNPFTHIVTTSVSQAVLVIPYLVLIAAAMFLQYYQMRQMNNRNPQAAAANPQMQTMQKFFPLIFGLIYLRVPAGATIYMVVSSAMRIGTQEVMFRSGMVAPVAAEREIGSTKDKADKPEPKPPPKQTPKQPRRSAATDGTSTGKGTVAPKSEAGSNGRPNTNANGRKPAARKANGKGGNQPEAPAPKPQNRSRSKRTRKAR
ncbi:MAG TPA: YidC/Oxa1 family membrane protein insertase [Acidimicrobiales bacterium]|nr:YidC/Oxa1 family membrane protein insertase [Acidimicrobiales bacterium]